MRFSAPGQTHMEARVAEPAILVSEVGPRDGLQMAKSIMPTQAKKRWIKAAYDAGVREIEVCSFVPPKLVPAMADAAEVTRFAASLNGLTVAVLAPNAKGAQAAMAAGAHKITVPISVSATHNKANVNRTPAESVEEIARICALRDDLPAHKRPAVEGGLSTVFGCTMEGEVPERDVLSLSVDLVRAGVDEVGLADTTGMANPSSIKRIFKAVRAEIGADKLAGAHLHNTYGLGLANALAALEVDVTTLDSSLAGLGGCPFAPGASGNIVTEDLVYMLHQMGLSTGIDLEALIATRAILAEAIPSEPLYGFLAEMGATRGGRAMEKVAAV